MLSKSNCASVGDVHISTIGPDVCGCLIKISISWNITKDQNIVDEFPPVLPKSLISCLNNRELAWFLKLSSATGVRIVSGSGNNIKARFTYSKGRSQRRPLRSWFLSRLGSSSTLAKLCSVERLLSRCLRAHPRKATYPAERIFSSGLKGLLGSGIFV